MVDNEKELYTDYIATLKRELALAQDRATRLEGQLAALLNIKRTLPEERAESFEPIKGRMNRREAQAVVSRYERQVMKDWSGDIERDGEPNADKISETIQANAGSSERRPEGSGRAV